MITSRFIRCCRVCVSERRVDENTGAFNEKFLKEFVPRELLQM